MRYSIDSLCLDLQPYSVRSRLHISVALQTQVSVREKVSG